LANYAKSTANGALVGLQKKMEEGEDRKEDQPTLGNIFLKERYFLE
jgi:hypothetical protein